jgi:DNA-binding cell septation regulator SpoVG
MSKNVIITQASQGNEGLAITLNIPSKRIDGGVMKTVNHWVSWDCIGKALFENYTDGDIEERRKLREEASNG